MWVGVPSIFSMKLYVGALSNFSMIFHAFDLVPLVITPQNFTLVEGARWRKNVHESTSSSGNSREWESEENWGLDIHIHRMWILGRAWNGEVHILTYLGISWMWNSTWRLQNKVLKRAQAALASRESPIRFVWILLHNVPNCLTTRIV